MYRYDIINHLIRRYGYKKYLEIGTKNGGSFKRIPLKYKIGIDPNPEAHATLKLTSDEFFNLSNDTFDIIFIDGLHQADQVHKDIMNALDALSPGGVIICHDMNPTSENMQKVPRVQKEWTGDGWKAWVYLRSVNLDLTMYVVDTDYGCGVIHRGEQKPLNIPTELTYKKLENQRVKLLNIISVDEFKKMES